MDIKTLWEKYYIALKQQEWSKAYVALGAIKEIRRDDSQVYLKTGDLLQRMGNTADAIVAYHKAAVYLVKEGFMQKAAAIFKIILRLDPANSEASAKLQRVIEIASSSKGAFAKFGPPTVAEPSLGSDTAVLRTGADTHIQEALKPTEATGPKETKEDEGAPSYNEISFPGDATRSEETGPLTYGEMNLTAPEEETSGLTDDIKELGPGYGEITLEEEETMEVQTGCRPAEITGPQNFEDFDDLLAEAAKRLPSVEEGPGLSAGLPSVFLPIGEEQAAEITGRAVKRCYAAGERIIKEGNNGDSIYYIQQGTVKVVAHILGKEFVLTTLAEGDVFGEVTFLTGRPRTASVVADGDIEVLEFNRALLEDAISRNPEVLACLNDLYDMRVSNTLKRIASD